MSSSRPIEWSDRKPKDGIEGPPMPQGAIGRTPMNPKTRAKRGIKEHNFASMTQPYGWATWQGLDLSVGWWGESSTRERGPLPALEWIDCLAGVNGFNYYIRGSANSYFLLITGRELKCLEELVALPPLPMTLSIEWISCTRISLNQKGLLVGQLKEEKNVPPLSTPRTFPPIYQYRNWFCTIINRVGLVLASGFGTLLSYCRFGSVPLLAIRYLWIGNQNMDYEFPLYNV